MEQGTPRNTKEEQKSGTSWNSGETTEHPGTQAEHPRIPTENQLNASKNTPEQRNHTEQRTTAVFFSKVVNLTFIH